MQGTDFTTWSSENWLNFPSSNLDVAVWPSEPVEVWSKSKIVDDDGILRVASRSAGRGFSLISNATFQSPLNLLWLVMNFRWLFEHRTTLRFTSYSLAGDRHDILLGLGEISSVSPAALRRLASRLGKSHGDVNYRTRGKWVFVFGQPRCRTRDEALSATDRTRVKSYSSWNAVIVSKLRVSM